MLTKNLVKYTSRNGAAFPKYLDPQDARLLNHAAEMSRIFAGAVGKSFKDLDSSIKALDKIPAVSDGFRKLLEDRCKSSDDEFDKVEASRWDFFRISKKLRSEGLGGKDDFDRAFLEEARISTSDAGKIIYSDLPENRKVSEFKEVNAGDLIHRFNAAQVQGLLIHSKEVRLKIIETDLIKRRRLFQRLKFFGLIVNSPLNVQSKKLEFSIGGPLSIFEGIQTYGVKLANFFPYILLMEKWELEADLKMGRKNLVLKSSSKKKIKSHYKDFTGHIPDELGKYVEAVNRNQDVRDRGWKASLSDEMISLESGAVCFPDISLLHESGRRKSIEIFHKWNQGQLSSRLGDLSKNDHLLIALPKSFIKSGDNEDLSDLLGAKGVDYIAYSSFPTVKALLTYLD